MGRLIYSAITSLDGYVDDRDGGFEWSAPDPEVHAFVNDRERDIGTYLYGRRMYEVLSAWETIEAGPEQPELRDYAGIWRSADKIVYSTTLAGTSSARTRLERRFDPAAVAAMKQSAHRDLSVGGPTLASTALRSGLVDELQLYLNPVLIGGGTAALPDDLRLDLELTEEHRFGNGVIFLAYRVRS